jgi:two-component system alkaline phosphatase synthesis response regulator PhoP
VTRHILIAEDEPNIAVSLEFLMRNGGYQVTMARDGEETLRMAEHAQPDLVLLDVMLPLKNGFDVCRELRRRHSAARIVMLTAKGHESEVARGYALGADAYVTKPFVTRDLLALVRRLLCEDA